MLDENRGQLLHHGQPIGELTDPQNVTQEVSRSETLSIKSNLINFTKETHYEEERNETPGQIKLSDNSVSFEHFDGNNVGVQKSKSNVLEDGVEYITINKNEIFLSPFTGEYSLEIYRRRNESVRVVSQNLSTTFHIPQKMVADSNDDTHERRAEKKRLRSNSSYSDNNDDSSVDSGALTANQNKKTATVNANHRLPNEQDIHYPEMMKRRIIKSRRKYFPKLVYDDIRYSMARMWNQVLNSHSHSMMYSFLRRYGHPSQRISHNHLTVIHQYYDLLHNGYMNMEGIRHICDKIYALMRTSPDGYFRFRKVDIVRNSKFSNASIIVAHCEYHATVVYEIYDDGNTKSDEMDHSRKTRVSTNEDDDTEKDGNQESILDSVEGEVNAVEYHTSIPDIDSKLQELLLEDSSTKAILNECIIDSTEKRDDNLHEQTIKVNLKIKKQKFRLFAKFLLLFHLNVHHQIVRMDLHDTEQHLTPVD